MEYDFTKTVHRDHRVTAIPIPRTDEVIEVSSVHYDIGDARLNETCVFFPNGRAKFGAPTTTMTRSWNNYGTPSSLGKRRLAPDTYGSRGLFAVY